VGQMLRQIWGLCEKIICTKAVLLIIRVYIIWINLRNERTCYLIYWTSIVYTFVDTFIICNYILRVSNYLGPWAFATLF
jgi:hypothetical protein